MCNSFLIGMISYKLVVIFFIIIILIVSAKAAPSGNNIRRDSSHSPIVKTLQVSKESHVDEDDGEVWYPTIDSEEEDSSEEKADKVKTSGKVERRYESVNYESNVAGRSPSDPDPDPDSETNYDSNVESEPMTQENEDSDEDWIHAIKVLFKKFGFSDDQIPEPFGSKKSQSINIPSPEFGLILQGLISKTPASLNEQLREIVQEAGIKDLDSKSEDKRSMLAKIDKTVKEIQGNVQHGDNKESKSHEHSHIDSDSSKSPASDSSYDGEVGESGENAENENSGSEASENFKHEEMTLDKDIEEIESIVGQLKLAFDKSSDASDNEVLRAEENVEKLSTLVKEVEEIAKKDVALLQSLPCVSEKYSHSVSKEHSSAGGESSFSQTSEIMEEKHEEGGHHETIAPSPQVEQQSVSANQEDSDIDKEASKIIAELKEIAEIERVRHDKHVTVERDSKETGKITQVLKDIHDLGEKEKERKMNQENSIPMQEKITKSIENQHSSSSSSNSHGENHPSDSSHSHGGHYSAEVSFSDSHEKQHSSNSDKDQEMRHSSKLEKSQAKHHSVSKAGKSHEGHRSSANTDKSHGEQHHSSSARLVDTKVSHENHNSKSNDEKDDEKPNSKEVLEEVGKIVEKEVDEVHIVSDEHKKHKEEMLGVIRKLKFSETSQEDQKRIKKIEDIIEQIDREHYKELELETKLESLTHDSVAQDDDEGKVKHSQGEETEEVSMHRIKLEQDPSEKHSHIEETEDEEVSVNMEKHPREKHSHSEETDEEVSMDRTENDPSEKHSDSEETEEASINFTNKEKDHNENLGTLKEKVRENDEKIKNYIEPNILKKFHSRSEHTSNSEINKDQGSEENLDNAAEFTEKFHHVKKTRKGAKHHQKSVQDAKETQFADIRQDSLKPYVENTATEKTNANAFDKQEENQQNQHQEHEQNSQQNVNQEQEQNSQDNSYDEMKISVEENIHEVITEKPLPLASVNFRHMITNTRPVQSQSSKHEDYESQNTQEESNSVQFDSNSHENTIDLSSKGQDNSNSYDTNKDYSSEQDQNQQQTNSADYGEESYSANSNVDEHKSESESNGGLVYKKDSFHIQNAYENNHENKNTAGDSDTGNGNSENSDMKPELKQVQSAIVDLEKILKNLNSVEQSEHKVEDILTNGPKFSENAPPDKGSHNHELSPEYLDNVIEDEREPEHAHHNSHHHVQEHIDAVNNNNLINRRWRRQARLNKHFRHKISTK